MFYTKTINFFYLKLLSKDAPLAMLAILLFSVESITPTLECFEKDNFAKIFRKNIIILCLCLY